MADLSGLKCDGDRLSVPKARRLADLLADLPTRPGHQTEGLVIQ